MGRRTGSKQTSDVFGIRSRALVRVVHRDKNLIFLTEAGDDWVSVLFRPTNRHLDVLS
jgi:hypothetical protein